MAVRRPRFGSPGSIVAGIVALSLAMGFAATRLSFLQGSAPSQGRAAPQDAPELRGISAWINSEPLTLASLRGRVTMIDFWTYSCINCIRTVPSNRRIYARYRASGFELIGVHSPEFDFEKSRANVADAVKRLRIGWPVAMDNEMATWRAYSNAYWPRVYLIDAQGRIRFDYAGEGHDAQIEDNIRTLLTEAGRRDLPEPIGFGDHRFDPRITPEIYAGYERGSQSSSLASREGFSPSEVVTYREPSHREIEAAGNDGSFFAVGSWRNEREYLEAAAPGARIILPFYARDVFFVASASPAAEVSLLLDGAPVPPGARPEGARLMVDRSDLFTALRLPKSEAHVLTIEAPKGFRLYTFTFG